MLCAVTEATPTSSGETSSTTSATPAAEEQRLDVRVQPSETGDSVEVTVTAGGVQASGTLSVTTL